MRPAPREPSKQLNAKSLPATKRRAASGVRLSAHAELAASKIKTTIVNRVTIQNLLPLRSRRAAQRYSIACRLRKGRELKKGLLGRDCGLRLPSGLRPRSFASYSGGRLKCSMRAVQ